LRLSPSAKASGGKDAEPDVFPSLSNGMESGGRCRPGKQLGEERDLKNINISLDSPGTFMKKIKFLNVDLH
jgi:hypothetical protein